MGATGTVDIDFGAWPGTPSASVDITGQTGIASGSLLEAWILPADTTDHTADEHVADPPRVVASQASIVAGMGFSVFGQAHETDARNTLMHWGKWRVGWVWN